MPASGDIEVSVASFLINFDSAVLISSPERVLVSGHLVLLDCQPARDWLHDWLHCRG
jgi:hypothetical protein